jgi:hypothetical protein
VGTDWCFLLATKHKTHNLQVIKCFVRTQLRHRVHNLRLTSNHMTSSAVYRIIQQSSQTSQHEQVSILNMSFTGRMAVDPPKQMPQNAELQINRTHSACNSDSLYHDLQCSHRVKTRYYEGCGANCSKQTGNSCGTAFICTICVTAKVRVEVLLASLSLDLSVSYTDPDHREKIKAIAQKEIDELIYKRHRPTTVVPKLDPMLQFFHEIPGAEDNGDFLSELGGSEPARKYKRPGLAARLPINTRWNPYDLRLSYGCVLARARSANTTNLHYDRMARLMGEAQNIVSSRHVERTARVTHMMVGNEASSGLDTGNLNLSQLQAGRHTHASAGPQSHPQGGLEMSQPHPAQPGPSNRGVQPTMINGAPNISEDAASRAVRQILEGLSLDDRTL